MSKIGLSLLGIALLLMAWEIASRLFDQSLILPGPTETFRVFFREISQVTFYRHLGATALRTLLGFAASLVTGLIWGVAAGLSQSVRSALAPALVFIRSTPVIAVILLAIIWFSPDVAPVLVTWLMVMPVVEQVIEHGLRRTGKKLLEMARVFRVPKGRVLRDIHLPGLRPYVVAAAHSGLGIAYKVTVAAEVLIQPPWSLGGAMQEARFYLDTPRIIALTLTVIILSGATEGLLRILDRLVDRESVPRRRRRSASPGQSGDGMTSVVSDRAGGGNGVDPAVSLPAVRLENVFKSFEGQAVLDDITLTAEHGRVTVLLGPSGCGKTTLLRIVAGLEAADSGAVQQPEETVSTMVFQEPRVLNWRSAEQNINFVLGSHESDVAPTWLARVGLGAHSASRPPALSGGMVQRLSLARAYAVPASLTLMDEPFQNLDLRTKLSLCGMTRSLHQQRGGATLFVTHDVVEAALVSDRIVVLSSQPARVLLELPNLLPDDVRDPRHLAIQEMVGRLYDTLLSSNQQ